MRRTLYTASSLVFVVLVAASFAFAQTRRDEAWHGTFVDPQVMAAKRIQYVAPVYPDMARAGHVEGTVVLHANIGTDGSVVGLQMISGHPLLIRAALEAAAKWRYEQTVRGGQPIQVDTTITIVFSLSDAGSTGPPPPLPTSGSVLIRLQNGQTIHADSARKDGDKIEFTIGENVFSVKESTVKEIQQNGQSLPSSQSPAGAAPTPHANASAGSDRVTATPLSAMPKNPAEDPANWSMYESTEQLREECRNGEISKRVHPEFQSTSSFPVSKDEADRECFALNVQMESDYERLIDRGTELERKLCTENKMRRLSDLSPELKSSPEAGELGQIGAELYGRFDAEKNRGLDRARGLRMLLDFYRLAGDCGQGM